MMRTHLRDPRSAAASRLMLHAHYFIHKIKFIETCVDNNPASVPQRSDSEAMRARLTHDATMHSTYPEYSRVMTSTARIHLTDPHSLLDKAFNTIRIITHYIEMLPITKFIHAYNYKRINNVENYYIIFV